MAELQSLRSALTDRITHLEKQIAPMAAPARQDEDPAPLALKRQAMTRLLMSGFSPELARRLADTVPPELERKETDPWLQNSLAQQIRCPGDAENAIYLPGAVALVGPTGVGKTTTVAKLAARFVVRHGASALGLITLDSYRMGAHEQLRSYGRILGVPVQAAHDEASLRDLLRSMHGKRKVLIDTCGMSQRDQRLGEMLAMLSEARFNDQQIRRVLLVNAASHAETLDEVARAWRVAGAHGAILTKVDEAARIGGGLDALIRYQLPLLGLTNGQRVPEDWHPGNAGLLAHIALKPFAAAFCLDNAEIQALTTAGVALV
jgi:flagellar biosynthesis protein FlhF